MLLEPAPWLSARARTLGTALVRTEIYVDAQGVPEETMLRFTRTPT